LPTGSSAAHVSPFAPFPLQKLPHYYKLIRPCAPHRYSHPCRVSTWISPLTPLFDTSSMVHLRSSLAYTPDMIFCHAFSSTLTTMALYHSNLRRFGTYALTSIPRGLPSSFVQLRTAYAVLLDTPERSGLAVKCTQLFGVNFWCNIFYLTVFPYWNL